MDKSQFTDVYLSNKLFRTLFFLVMFLVLVIPEKSQGQSISGKSNTIKIKIKDPQAGEKSLKPSIKWIYPNDSKEVLDQEFNNIKLGITSHAPLVKVTLILNGEVVNVYDRFTESQPKGYLFDAWIEQAILLPKGENNLVLVVQNELGTLQHKRKLKVNVAPRDRKDYALIVGTDEYNSYSNLSGPVRDAERLAKALEIAGFQIDLVRDATTFDVLDKLEEYAKMDYGPHDQLLVYFAGNGYYDEQTGRGHLICKNSIKSQSVNVTYLSYEVIKSILNNISVPHIFLLMDAVKGQGEALPLARNHPLIADVRPTEDSSMHSAGTTRIGLLSGVEDYKWNTYKADGSPLSTAFITYLRQSASHPFSWLELIEEFEKIHPKPIYVEFGDHVTGNGFTFQLGEN